MHTCMCVCVLYVRVGQKRALLFDFVVGGPRANAPRYTRSFDHQAFVCIGVVFQGFAVGCVFLTFFLGRRASLMDCLQTWLDFFFDICSYSNIVFVSDEIRNGKAWDIYITTRSYILSNCFSCYICQLADAKS